MLCACLWLAACDGPTYKYRYRLTLAVEANGEMHSGSSVVEVREWRTSEWSLNPHLWLTKVSGEATFVDLGQGRALVALLEGISEGTPANQRGDREWIGPATSSVLLNLLHIDH
jgi:hypothetical protein